MKHLDRLTEHLGRVIVGKAETIRLLLVALLSGGHVLLEDVPGVGKTLLAKSLAGSIDGKFQRIQCTPDLLPTDVTGTNIWHPGTRTFEFIPGPVFANVLLADEINRATPRTQAALLEVMEEQQVTTDGESRAVPHPFLVVATQNPIEYQGTFPLPEAQMDRFMLSLSLGYPSEVEELQMLQRQHSQELLPCLAIEDLLELQHLARQTTITIELQQYIVDLVRSTRSDEDITLGVSPRGTIALQQATRSLAFLQGRTYAIPDDVKYLAPYVLCHRLVMAGGRSAQSTIQRLLRSVPVEKGQVSWVR